MTMKFYRKDEWLTLRLHGEALARLRKPTTPEWVDAVGQMPKIDAAIHATIAAVRGTLAGPVDMTIPGAELEALARWLARWTIDLVGVETGGGEAIAWSSLDEEARAAFWEEAALDDLTHAWSCLRLAQFQNGKHLDAARSVAITPADAPAPLPAEPPASAGKKPARKRKPSRTSAPSKA